MRSVHIITVIRMNAEVIEEEFERLSKTEFLEVKSCLLREGAWTDETLNEWLSKMKGDLSAVEAMINHVHIYRLFWEGGDELAEQQVIDLGRKLKNTWELRLRKQFPDKDIVVSFDEEVPKDGWLGDLQVTAYVNRNV